MNKLTRREFFAFSCLPFFVPKAVARAVALSHDAVLSVPFHAEDAPGLNAVEALAHSGDCPECRGYGRITCPACDGTALWTEASESAGLYQREAACAYGHCAWCNESGEAVCQNCLGLGVVPLEWLD